MRTLILGAAVVTPAVFIASAFAGAPLPGLIVMVIAHALVIYGTIRPNVQWWGPVVTHFESERREVWLTIDDGPTEDTPQVLELLASRGVHATFFVRGSLVATRPDLAAAIISGGHTIGNHSHTHPSGFFWCLPPRRIAAEIDQCTEALAAVTRPSLFRAPVGTKNPFVHPELRRRAMTLVGWSVRTFDAVRSDVEEVAARTARHLTSGGIIVMHQGREWSLRVIARVIDDCHAAGYTFVIPPPERLKTKR